MSRHEVIINGSKMSYLDEGQGFPLLLGHSYLWSAEMWRPQIDRLSQYFRVLVPDLWGHGESDSPPAGTASMSDLTRHHLAFLDVLGIDQCHLVGLSVGGMWGAELAIQAPQRIDHLVLMDTYLGAEPEGTREYYFNLLRQADEAGRFTEEMINIIAPIFFHPGGATVPEIRKQFKASLANASSQTIRESLVPLGHVIFGRPDLLDQLPRLRAGRTIILGGDKDIPRPPAEALEMAHLINCLSAQIPLAGHISNLENPQAVTDFLLNWLPRN